MSDSTPIVDNPVWWLTTVTFIRLITSDRYLLTSLPLEDVGNHQQARIAADNAGNLHLVYLYSKQETVDSVRTKTETIYYSKFSGGIWSPPAVAYSFTTSLSRCPQILDLHLVVDNLLRPHILWLSSYGASPRIEMNNNDYLYIYHDGSSWTTPVNLTDSIRGDYMSKTLTWENGADLPVTVDGIESAITNGKLYVYKGPNMYEYNPSTNSWATKASYPGISLSRGGAGAINNLVHVVSGFESPVNIYDPSTDSWSTGSSIGTIRQYPGVIASGGVLYVMGGTNSSSEILSSIEIYDPGSNSWSIGTDMLRAREKMAIAAVNTDIYVFGGNTSGGTTNYIDVYDTTSDTWSTLGWGTGGAPFPTKSSWLGGSYDGNIYLYGADGPEDEVREFYLAEKLFRPMQFLDVGRRHAGGGMIGSKMYLAGGTNNALGQLTLFEI